MCHATIDQQAQNEKRTGLAVTSTAHNFGEIMSAVLILTILAADTVCHGAGLSSNGSLANVMPAYYREGMVAAFQGGVPSGETAAVLLVVLTGRICGTLLEERCALGAFGPQRKDIKRYLQLLIGDGPPRIRVMCVVLVVAQFVIVTARLPFYSRFFALNDTTSN